MSLLLINDGFFLTLCSEAIPIYLLDFYHYSDLLLVKSSQESLDRKLVLLIMNPLADDHVIETNLSFTCFK